MREQKHDRRRCSPRLLSPQAIELELVVYLSLEALARSRELLTRFVLLIAAPRCARCRVGFAWLRFRLLERPSVVARGRHNPFEREKNSN